MPHTDSIYKMVWLTKKVLVSLLQNSFKRSTPVGSPSQPKAYFSGFLGRFSQAQYTEPTPVSNE